MRRQIEEMRQHIESEKNALATAVEAEKRKSAQIEVDLHREIENLQQTHWRKESELEAQLATVESLRNELKARLARSEEDAKRSVEEARQLAAQAHDELVQQVEEERARLQTMEELHKKEVNQLKSNLEKLDSETQQAIRAQVSS